MRRRGRACFYLENRVDFFNFADIAADREDWLGVLLIQTTSRSNVSARLAKIKANPHAARWIRSGKRIVVHGWYKDAKINRWKVRVVEVTKEMFDGG